MEWESALAQLVEFVETAAPMVWAMARRQVIVSMIQSAAWAIGLALYARWGILKVKQYDDIDDLLDDPIGFFNIFATIGAYIAVPVAIGLAVGVASRLINPDFYAMQLLLGFTQ